MFGVSKIFITFATGNTLVARSSKINMISNSFSVDKVAPKNSKIEFYGVLTSGQRHKTSMLYPGTPLFYSRTPMFCSRTSTFYPRTSLFYPGTSMFYPGTSTFYPRTPLFYFRTPLFYSRTSMFYSRTPVQRTGKSSKNNVMQARRLHVLNNSITTN
jgi:hypothetical protein